MKVLRLITILSSFAAFTTNGLAQELAVPTKTQTVDARATLATAFRGAKRVGCTPADAFDCGFHGLIITSGTSEQCTEPVIPTDRFQIGNTAKHGVVINAQINVKAPTQATFVEPILVLLQNDRLQAVCIPYNHTISNINAHLLLRDWKKLPLEELAYLPDSQSFEIKNINPIGNVIMGGFLGKSNPTRLSVQAPGILDWIFNSGRQEPIKLQVESKPVGGAVYVGSRRIGSTAQEFGLSPKQIKNVFVVLEGKRIPINECTQIAREAWVKVLCTSPIAAR